MSIEEIQPTRAQLIEVILEQYPRLDRGMAELALDVHKMMQTEHGEDYDPEKIFGDTNVQSNVQEETDPQGDREIGGQGERDSL